MAAPPFDRRAIPPEAKLGTWTASDGWTLRRIDWEQPNSGAARGRLLFAGGRGDFIEKYLEAQHHWFARGWSVTAFDWRGQGGSRRRLEEGAAAAAFDRMVEDLAGLLAELTARATGPHVAIGHSMGGHLLLRTLAERAPPLDAAVLVAPMLAINSAPLPHAAAAATASLMTAIGWGGQPAWHQPRSAPAGSVRQAILTACRERYEDELYWWEKAPDYSLGAPTWGWLRAAYESCGRLTPAALAKVATPVLLVGTDTDRLVGADAIRAAARRLPHAELLMFPCAGHEILREEDAVRLAALARIDAFLDVRAPARA